MERNIAILVDGENAYAPETLGQIVQLASTYGLVKIRRIYGNWLSTHMHKWKPCLNKYAFQPVQVFPKTTSKNAVDIVTVVDAMDLLYQGYKGFCIVASDSDYTPLVLRLRQEGCLVVGIGKSGTALADACDKFFTVEDVRMLSDDNTSTVPNAKQVFDDPNDELADILLDTYYHTLMKSAGDSVSLPTYGSMLRLRYNSFDPAEYGIAGKLKKVIQERKDLFLFLQTNDDKGTTDKFALRKSISFPYRAKALCVAFKVACEQQATSLGDWIAWTDVLKVLGTIEPDYRTMMQEKTVQALLQKLLSASFDSRDHKGKRFVRLKQRVQSGINVE